jgi:predicted ArsR family transcriptional regulator
MKHTPPGPLADRVYALLLSANGYTSYDIARILDVPAPSVRRALSDLRNSGHTIGRMTFEHAPNAAGVYRLFR